MPEYGTWVDEMGRGYSGIRRESWHIPASLYEGYQQYQELQPPSFEMPSTSDFEIPEFTSEYAPGLQKFSDLQSEQFQREQETPQLDPQQVRQFFETVYPYTPQRLGAEIYEAGDPYFEQALEPVKQFGRETGKTMRELGRESFDEAKELGRETGEAVRELGRESYVEARELGRESKPILREIYEAEKPVVEAVGTVLGFVKEFGRTSGEVARELGRKSYPAFASEIKFFEQNILTPAKEKVEATAVKTGIMVPPGFVTTQPRQRIEGTIDILKSGFKEGGIVKETGERIGVAAPPFTTWVDPFFTEKMPSDISVRINKEYQKKKPDYDKIYKWRQEGQQEMVWRRAEGDKIHQESLLLESEIGKANTGQLSESEINKLNKKIESYNSHIKDFEKKTASSLYKEIEKVDPIGAAFTYGVGQATQAGAVSLFFGGVPAISKIGAGIGKLTSKVPFGVERALGIGGVLGVSAIPAKGEVETIGWGGAVAGTAGRFVGFGASFFKPVKTKLKLAKDQRSLAWGQIERVPLGKDVQQIKLVGETKLWKGGKPSDIFAKGISRKVEGLDVGLYKGWVPSEKLTTKAFQISFPLKDKRTAALVLGRVYKGKKVLPFKTIDVGLGTERAYIGAGVEEEGARAISLFKEAKTKEPVIDWFGTDTITKTTKVYPSTKLFPVVETVRPPTPPLITKGITTAGIGGVGVKTITEKPVPISWLGQYDVSYPISGGFGEPITASTTLTRGEPLFGLKEEVLPSYMERDLLKERRAFDTKMKQIQRTLERTGLETAAFQPLGLRMAQPMAFRFGTRMGLRTKPITITKTIQRMGMPTPKPFFPRTPIPKPFLIKLPKGEPMKYHRARRKKRLVPAWLPEVRRRGIWRPITKKPVGRGAALFFGARRVKRGLGATFRIKGVKGLVQPSPLFKFRPSPKIFRLPKGKKELPLTFVQKKKFRLHHPLEVREIQRARKRKPKKRKVKKARKKKR